MGRQMYGCTVPQHGHRGGPKNKLGRAIKTCGSYSCECSIVRLQSTPTRRCPPSCTPPSSRTRTAAAAPSAVPPRRPQAVLRRRDPVVRRRAPAAESATTSVPVQVRGRLPRATGRRPEFRSAATRAIGWFRARGGKLGSAVRRYSVASLAAAAGPAVAGEPQVRVGGTACRRRCRAESTVSLLPKTASLETSAAWLPAAAAVVVDIRPVREARRLVGLAATASTVVAAAAVGLHGPEADHRRRRHAGLRRSRACAAAASSDGGRTAGR